jgi:hypothetical protein
LVRPLGVVVDHEHARQVALAVRHDVVEALGLPTLEQAEKRPTSRRGLSTLPDSFGQPEDPAPRMKSRCPLVVANPPGRS